jgi:aminoglycoside phosphotransferase family enzyme
MTAFGGRLSKAQIDAIATYVAAFTATAPIIRCLERQRAAPVVPPRPPPG